MQRISNDNDDGSHLELHYYPPQSFARSGWKIKDGPPRCVPDGRGRSTAPRNQQQNTRNKLSNTTMEGSLVFFFFSLFFPPDPTDDWVSIPLASTHHQETRNPANLVPKSWFCRAPIRMLRGLGGKPWDRTRRFGDELPSHYSFSTLYFSGGFWEGPLALFPIEK